MKGLWLGLAGVVLAGQADAATVTRAFELTASQFASFNGTPSPIGTLNARFRVTYDDAANGFMGAPDQFVAVTDGRTNAGPFSAAPAFGYFQANAFSTFPRLVVGGAVNGTNVSLPNTDDFFFSFDASASGPTRAMLSFVLVNGPAFLASDAVVTELAAGGVPEPRSWAMLIAGFGAIGTTLRRARRPRAGAVA